MTRSNNTLNISVTRAVRASDKSLHYLLESDSGSIWVSLADLHKNERETIGNIAISLEIPLLSQSHKNEVKRIIDGTSTFDDGIVATQQGYVTPEIYVHANGDITQSSYNKKEPIVAFNVDVHAGTCGSMKGWKGGITKSIYGNEFATFILCFGFSPLLLRFVSSSILNPFLEITGEKLTGKTTLASTAASIYGGDPQSDIGYGHSWDTTDGALPELKRSNAHGLLFLDENNVQGDTLRQNGKVAFLQSSTSDRKRMGDIKRKQPVRMSLLSTGNRPPVTATSDNKDEVEAAKSRMLHLHFSSHILNQCPPDFDCTKAANRALRSHINEHYGHAVRAFTKQVVEANAKNQRTFENQVMRLMTKFHKKATDYSDVDDRILDTMALCYAAGRLAKRWNILPSGCSNVMDAALGVLAKITEDKTSISCPELNRVKAILAKNENQIETYNQDSRPRKKDNPNNLFASRTPLSDRKTLYCVHPKKLRNELGVDAITVLKHLKSIGILQGQKTKLIFPAPIFVPFSKPVYKIILVENCAKSTTTHSL